MAEILFFHHARGLTPGCSSLADRWRAAGHVVHTPDLYEGRDGYLAGEKLHVFRNGDTITHLNVATFVLTRTPYEGRRL